MSSTASRLTGSPPDRFAGRARWCGSLPACPRPAPGPGGARVMRSEMRMTTFILCSTNTTVRRRRARGSAAWSSPSPRAHPGGGSSSRSRRRIGRERDAELEVSLLTVREMRREHVELGGEPEWIRVFTARSRTSLRRSDRDQKLKERAWPCTATRTFSARRGAGRRCDLVRLRDTQPRRLVLGQAGDLLAVEPDAPRSSAPSRRRSGGRTSSCRRRWDR